MALMNDVQIEVKNGCLWTLMPRFIDSENQEQIQDSIEHRLDNSIDRVVMDLQNVVSISSFAIGLIMRIRGILEKKNCSLYFINVSDSCYEQLETVNLHKILPVLD